MQQASALNPCGRGPISDAKSSKNTSAHVHVNTTRDVVGGGQVHADKHDTHIVSAIINVAQEVDEPWPLELFGHDGKVLSPASFLAARVIHHP